MLIVETTLCFFSCRLFSASKSPLQQLTAKTALNSNLRSQVHAHIHDYVLVYVHDEAVNSSMFSTHHVSHEARLECLLIGTRPTRHCNDVFEAWRRYLDQEQIIVEVYECESLTSCYFTASSDFSSRCGQSEEGRTPRDGRLMK